MDRLEDFITPKLRIDKMFNNIAHLSRCRLLRDSNNTMHYCWEADAQNGNCGNCNCNWNMISLNCWGRLSPFSGPKCLVDPVKVCLCTLKSSSPYLQHLEISIQTESLFSCGYSAPSVLLQISDPWWTERERETERGGESERNRERRGVR